MNKSVIQAQRDMIIEHLLRGRSITALEAQDKFGCMRLGARIFELKEKFNITKETITVKNRWGKSVKVASYSLEVIDD